MKIKHLLLCKILRRIFQIILFFTIANISLGLTNYLFNAPSFIKVINSRIVHAGFISGYPVRLSATIHIPDSTKTYISSNNTVASFPSQRVEYNSKNIYASDNQYHRKDLITNKISILDNNKVPINVLNDHFSAREITFLLHSSNKGYNFIWMLNNVAEYVFYALFLWILIVLISAYIKGKFIEGKIFNWISLLGLLLILQELFRLVFMYINSRIISSIHQLSTLNGDYFKNIIINFSLFNSVHIAQFAIGMLVIVLSEIIKNSIIIKQENDLTI